MTEHCNELGPAFESQSTNKINKWLEKLENENNTNLDFAKECKIEYLISLHGKIAAAITIINEDLTDSEKCLEQVRIILGYLGNVVNQRDVRDKLITEVIHPIFKKWGYKKRKRAFYKEENEITKKVNVFSSKRDEYYEVRFRFEISTKGLKRDLLGETVTSEFFELTDDTNLEELKTEIREQLLNVIKPFLDNI